MTSAMLTDLLKSLGLLGGALMVGVFFAEQAWFSAEDFHSGFRHRWFSSSVAWATGF